MGCGLVKSLTRHGAAAMAGKVYNTTIALQSYRSLGGMTALASPLLSTTCHHAIFRCLASLACVEALPLTIPAVITEHAALFERWKGCADPTCSQAGVPCTVSKELVQ